MENPSSDMLPRLNFEFAFNNANFADRVLHIEITADSSDSMSASEECNGVRKRIKLDSKNEHSPVAEVKTLNISSPILAANSPFFLKLFDNGMKESQQKVVTLTINKSEDAALIELLNFMYNNTLTVTTISDLLGVLIIADKFEVTSCIKYCSKLLQERPMSLESALLYLELPPSVLMAEFVQPLIDATKKWLVTRFKNINCSCCKFQEEAMALPLSAVEVVCGSDSLQADSGDAVFEFILKWARAHYPKLEVRREMFIKRLTKIIPFSHMSCSKLKEALICAEFDYEEVSKLVLETIFLKVELPYGQLINASSKCQLIKVEQIDELSKSRCIVYFDLKKEECENLLPSSSLHSPTFCLCGRWFYVLPTRYTWEQRETFGLFIGMTDESEDCSLDYEFAVMKKSSKEFQTIIRKAQFNNSDLRKVKGFGDLFGVPWIDFMSKDSNYFIDGILHLRADLTVNDSDDQA